MSLGFLSKSRYLPDRRDLNRSFPGHEQGSMASRLAHLFIEEIVAHCTHGIDLHTAAVGRTNLPQIRADLTHHPELQSMAQAFSTPVILNTSIREGSLRHAASEKSVQTLLYEAGEALRFEEIPIRAGVRGILSVMRQLEMLPSKKRPKHFTPLLSHRSRWVRSPQSGILRAIKSMGKFVNQGDILGYVADPFGDTEITVHLSYFRDYYRPQYAPLSSRRRGFIPCCRC